MPTFALLLALATSTTFAAGFDTVGYVQHSWTYPNVIMTPMVATAGAPVISATTSKALFLVPGDLEAARFRTDGTPDSTFGQQGRTSIPLKGQAIVALAFPLRSGGIQYLGLSRAGMTEDFDILSLRLNSNGTPDLTHGKGGISYFDLDFGSQEAVVDGIAARDDSVVLLGTSVLNDVSSLFLMKVTAGGSLDPFFGQSGIQPLKLPQGITPRKLFLYPDDSLMLVGYRPEKTLSRLVMYHFRPDGTPDTSFGKQGEVLVIPEADTSETLTSTIVSSDGKLLVLGSSRLKNNVVRPFLARLDALTGKLDPTFAGNGFKLIAPTLGKACNYQVTGEDPNGGYVLAGNCSSNGKLALGITRFLDDGALDAAFGTGGVGELGITGTTLGFSVSLFRSGAHWMVHSQAQKSGQPIGSLVARFTETGMLAVRSSED